MSENEIKDALYLLYISSSPATRETDKYKKAFKTINELVQTNVSKSDKTITLGMMWPRTEDDKLTVRLEGTQEQIIPYALWNSERGSKIIISMLYPTMTVEQAKVQETGEFILDIEEEEFDSFYKDIGLEIPKKEWEDNNE